MNNTEGNWLQGSINYRFIYVTMNKTSYKF